MRAKYFGMVSTQASADYTELALSTFFEHTTLNANDLFFLIDNDQQLPNSLKYKYGNIVLLRNRCPLSFAQNVNQVLKKSMESRADLIFLNNDLIFTSDWLPPLLENDQAIVSPLSNLEAQYETNVFTTRQHMSLDDYLGKEDELEQLIRAHRASLSGYRETMLLPFYCIRIPYTVLRAVGLLDERFGIGGAEDYDYCLRTHLTGFRVKYALQSYVIHFGGKSSWSGVQTPTEREEIDLKFKTEFAVKWGLPLMRFCLMEDTTLINNNPALETAMKLEQFRTVIEQLRAISQPEPKRSIHDIASVPVVIRPFKESLEENLELPHVKGKPPLKDLLN